MNETIKNIEARIETLKALRDEANLALRLKDVRFFESKIEEMYAEKLEVELELYTRWGFQVA
jgi:hypothetical protein